MAQSQVLESTRIEDHERRTGRGHPQLEVSVARTLEEVEAGWRLAYETYHDKGLISGNPYGIHTHPAAIQRDTVVVVGRYRHKPICTITTMHDAGMGLPLDAVYPEQFQKLRDQGRRLVEVGMLADRREDVRQGMPIVLEMVRYAYFRAFHFADDLMCGVHPHHVGFYQRYLGFDVFGECTTHPGVNDNLVVLLRLPCQEKLASDKLARGTRIFHRKRFLERSEFDDHFQLDDEVIAGTNIGHYMSFRRPTRRLAAVQAV